MTSWANVTNSTLAHRLTVVYNADHNAQEVYTSIEGTSALFDDSSNVQLGWRPQGWRNVTTSTQTKSPAGGSTGAGANSSPAATIGSYRAAAASMALAALVSIAVSLL